MKKALTEWPMRVGIAIKTIRSDLREMDFASDLNALLSAGDLQLYDDYLHRLPPPKMEHGDAFVFAVWGATMPFNKEEIRTVFWQRILSRRKDPGFLYGQIALAYDKRGMREKAMEVCRMWTAWEPERAEAIALLAELKKGLG